jgi:hypothetical protein
MGQVETLFTPLPEAVGCASAIIVTNGTTTQNIFPNFCNRMKVWVVICFGRVSKFCGSKLFYNQ